MTALAKTPGAVVVARTSITPADGKVTAGVGDAGVVALRVVERRGAGRRLVGQVLRAREGRGVCRGLEMALRAPPRAAVDHERGHADEHRERKRDEDERLPGVASGGA